LSAKLSVVIVNYNTRAYLPACLDALLASTLIPEMILVDNDGRAADLEASYPAVKRLAPAENRWFCGGNNLGLEAATGDYVLLLNPDTVVQPDALAALVAFMDTHPHYQGATM
jgi:GT2 family glycosyltransferase